MAILSQTQAIALIQAPANSDQLLRAASLERRVKLHTQAAIDTGTMQSEYAHFKDWVSGILPPDKMEGFLQLWTAPGETNELAETIFGELFRVFQAENPYTDHKFKGSSDLIADFDEFLEKIDDQKFWTVHYWNELKTDQNSIMVVDLPPIQSTPRPEPYIYLLDISAVIDASVTRDGCFDYLIAFTHEAGLIMVLDDISWSLYRVELNEQGQADMEKVTFEQSIPHNLGRVPAKPLYFQPISKAITIVNHNPITKSLSRWDWLLFWEVAKKYLETYAPFPIYATYTEANDSIEVRDDKGEEYYTGGRDNLIAPGERITSVSDGSPAKNLANRKLIGPGTIQRYDMPRDKDESDPMSSAPVQVIPAEEVSLTYAHEEAARKNDIIFSRCVGRGGDVLNNQAANELQVQSTFESRINILGGIRGRIEEAKKYIYELIGDLRYGDKLYLGSDVSLGDIYYLTTVKDQQDELKQAKEAGLPVYELQNQIQSIYRNKYREQPQLLARNQILAELEPYAALTIQEVADLVGKGYANKDKFRVKVEFENLIRRFEREQMNIVDFASVQSLATKIDTIFTKLLEYVREDDTTDDSEGQQKPGNGNDGGTGERPLPAPSGEGAVGKGAEGK